MFKCQNLWFNYFFIQKLSPYLMIIKQKNKKIKNDEIINEYWKSINNQKKCISLNVFIYEKKSLHHKIQFMQKNQKHLHKIFTIINYCSVSFHNLYKFSFNFPINIYYIQEIWFYKCRAYETKNLNILLSLISYLNLSQYLNILSN